MRLKFKTLHKQMRGNTADETVILNEKEHESTKLAAPKKINPKALSRLGLTPRLLLPRCFLNTENSPVSATMKPDGLLRAYLVPATLALALQAWTTPCLFVAGTLEQCRLDCAGNTTSELVADAALNGGVWSVWDTQRLVGPTEPAAELNATYPFAWAPFPLPIHSFCQLGCSFFFAGWPRTTTCGALCDEFYARDVSVGINDYAEKVGGTISRLGCMKVLVPSRFPPSDVFWCILWRIAAMV